LILADIIGGGGDIGKNIILIPVFDVYAYFDQNGEEEGVDGFEEGENEGCEEKEEDVTVYDPEHHSCLFPGIGYGVTNAPILKIQGEKGEVKVVQLTLQSDSQINLGPCLSRLTTEVFARTPNLSYISVGSCKQDVESDCPLSEKSIRALYGCQTLKMLCLHGLKIGCEQEIALRCFKAIVGLKNCSFDGAIICANKTPILNLRIIERFLPDNMLDAKAVETDGFNVQSLYVDLGGGKISWNQLVELRDLCDLFE